jgi:NDP-sugar pyrophosphorylase family protein
MKAIIVAGGLGKRLRPLTYELPKPLLPLGDTTIIERLIRKLRTSGATDLYIATRYMGAKIRRTLGDGERYGVSLHYVEEDRPLGTCGPAALVGDALSEPFLLINSDIVTELDFASFYDDALRSGAALTVGTTVTSVACRFGVVSADDVGVVKDFEEKPRFPVEILAGVYCLDPMVRRFITPNESFGIDDLIEALFTAGVTIKRRLITDTWIDVGEIDDYQRAVTQFSGRERGNEVMPSTAMGSSRPPILQSIQ